MKWNKVMNFGDPSTFGTEMADRFVPSGANLPPPVSNRVKRQQRSRISRNYFEDDLTKIVKKVKTLACK